MNTLDISLSIDLYGLEPPEPPLGTTMVESRPNVLLLDLDTQESVVQFVRLLPLLERFHAIGTVSIWASRAKGTHAMICLKEDFNEITRLLLQAILGSDPVREFLGLERQLRGVFCSVLFKPQNSAEELG